MKTWSVTRSSLVLLLLAVLALSPNLCDAEENECFEFQPPLLMDSTDSCAATYQNPRAIQIKLFHWNGAPLLLYNRGNELSLVDISDPMVPQSRGSSQWYVPPAGDRDQNLFNYAVCDDCRYGMAGFEEMGTVLFDLGTSDTPHFSDKEYYDDAGNVGSVVFEHGGQEYLLINRFPGCANSAGLYRFNGIGLDDLELVECVTTGSSDLVLYGGLYLPGSPAHIYAVDGGDYGHIYRVDGGSEITLTYLGTPFRAPMNFSQGLAVDVDAELAVTARNGIITLFDIASPGSPAEITHWQPNTASRYAVAAIKYPYLWVAERGLRETLTYDIRVPAVPKPIAVEFWEYTGDNAGEWNTYPCMDNRHAVFTDDAGWLFAARFSVLERFQVLDTCLPPVDAEFDWSPKPAVVDEPVFFTDTSAGEVTTWAWDFGDGVGTSSEQNPSYTYTAAGTYTVSLEVSDGTNTASVAHDLEVVEAPPPVYVYFIPAAAAGSGAAGSFWLTDVDINNAGAEAANYQFWWLPRDADNSAPMVSQSFTLGAGMTVRYADLVTAIGASGFGAVAVQADSPALLIMSRTYNQGGDTQQGTFGQSIPGYRSDEAIQPGSRLRVLFMTESDAFRSNFGVQNATGESITVRIELFGADGASLATAPINLLPYGNTQLNQVFTDFEPLPAGYLDVWSDSGAFFAYGSVVDNVTSDPTTVLPRALP